MNTELQEVLMKVIANAGFARSLAMEAIALAKKGKFTQASEKIDTSQEFLNLAHSSQTQLLVKEAGEDEHIDVSLFMVHAQDHLMNAIAIKDMAIEFIDVYKELKKESETND